MCGANIGKKVLQHKPLSIWDDGKDGKDVKKKKDEEKDRVKERRLQKEMDKRSYWSGESIAASPKCMREQHHILEDLAGLVFFTFQRYLGHSLCDPFTRFMDILDKRRGAGWPAHCDFLNHMALSQGILNHVRTRGLKMRNLWNLFSEMTPAGARLNLVPSA